MSCNHDCSNCSKKSGENCFLVEPNKKSIIRKRIGVVSGKGGVGKSLVTSLLASGMSKAGYRCAVLDADITGPSMGKVFGITEKATGTDTEIYPAITKTGIQLISTNMLLENDEIPVIWRGPVIAGMVKQFYTDVVYTDVDYMFIDMPPGTGDVPLTVFQSIPLDGIVIVTSPQDLVSMIVSKAVNMARQMDIPVLGLIENMSYIECPDCGKKLEVFGVSKVDEVGELLGLPVLAKLPIRSDITRLSDEGRIEDAEMPEIEGCLNLIKSL